jgi:hypothetical protein
MADVSVAAQSPTGAVVGVVNDDQGRVVPDAVVRLTAEGPTGVQTQTTNEHGQLRFPALPPGLYVVDVEAPGFAPYHEERIRIGVGATLERTIVLLVAGVRESLVVGGSGSQEPRGILAGVQRRRDRGGEASIREVAGVCVVYLRASVRTAGLERRFAGRFTSKHDRRYALSHLRAGSEQPDKRARPAAE